ncbi:MAG: hypothetical protein ACR2IE_11575 [Candidatus Sumerlaeaceae bacterium]
MTCYARGSIAFIGRLALIAIVCLLSITRGANAAVAVETNDLLEFEYQQTGANEEEAVRLACIRAVQASVGKILFSDYALQARDLLDPYIQKNWQKFTAAFHVLERRADRDGFGTRIRIQTFPEVLTRDLRQKKFLYLAQPNPYHYVFLAESVDGTASSFDLGRRAINETLVSEGLKIYESGVQSPTNNSDVLASPAFLAAARAAATKLGAEVMLVGSVGTRKVAEEQVYYDKVSSYEAAVHLEMIKTDDGRVMASVDYTSRSSDKDAGAARDDSIRSAVQWSTNELISKTRGQWRKLVVDDPKFSVMFTDLTPEESHLVSRYLQNQLSFGTRVYLKSWFGNVAILNVDTDRAYASLERALIDFKQFDLRISDRQGKRITVDVHH